MRKTLAERQDAMKKWWNERTSPKKRKITVKKRQPTREHWGAEVMARSAEALRKRQDAMRKRQNEKIQAFTNRVNNQNIDERKGMLYLCRWPNGDVSFVAGRSRAEIDDILDEVGNPDMAEMIRINHCFAVHLKLKEKAGDDVQRITDLLELEQVDEGSYDALDEAYPELDSAFHEICDLEEDAEGKGKPTEEQIAATQGKIAKIIEDALEAEKERLEPKEVDLSSNPLAAKLQLQMDAPRSLIESARRRK